MRARAVAGGGAGLALALLTTSPPAAAPAWAQEATAADTGARATVRVRLRTTGGVAVRGAAVRLRGIPDPWRSGASPGRVVEEASPGLYVAEVPPGWYRLSVAAAGHEPAARQLSVPAGGTGIVVELEPRPVPLAELIASVRRGTEDRFAGHAVDRVRFHEERPPAGTLGEWLAGLPGVEVRRRGAAGRQVLSLRGSRPEGVLVLLDGVPLNDPLTGTADLSTVPLSTLESATLVRGATAAVGPGALAGVLLLSSRRPEGTAAVAGLEAGSHGSVAADAWLSLAGEGARVSLAARHQRVENDYSFENRVLPGTPTERRRNADAEATHFALAASLRRVPVSLRLRADAVERGTPGRMGNRLFDRARWRDRSVRAHLRWGDPSGAGLDASAAFRGAAYRDPRLGEESRHHAGELRVAGSIPLGSADEWTLSARLAREVAGGDALAGEEPRPSGGVSAARRLGLGPLTVRPALSVEAAPGIVAANPEVSASLRAGAGWRLWTRAGRALRLPTFADLYFASEHRVRPNPGLDPERVRLDAEVGASWEVPGAGIRARATAYYRRTADPIVWLASSAAVWSPRNLEGLEAAGLELEGRWAPAAGWSVEAGGTLDRSRVRFGSNHNPLPYAPAVRARLATEHRSGLGAVGGEVRITGSRTTDLAANYRLPAFAVVDLTVRRPLELAGVPLEATLRVRNLLDQRYELVELFPQAGRALEIRFAVGPLLSGAEAGSRGAADRGVADPETGTPGRGAAGPGAATRAGPGGGDGE